MPCVSLRRGHADEIESIGALRARLPPAEMWRAWQVQNSGVGGGGQGTSVGVQTGREDTFQSDVVKGLGLDDGAGMDPHKTAVTMSSTACCHLCTIFLTALGPPWVEHRARKSETGTTSLPTMRRSRLMAVARQVRGTYWSGHAVNQAWTRGWGGEQWAR